MGNDWVRECNVGDVFTIREPRAGWRGFFDRLAARAANKPVKTVVTEYEVTTVSGPDEWREPE